MRLPTLHHLVDLLKLNFSDSPADVEEAVELRVHMDCPGCERTVRKALSRLKGIHSVDIDREKQKVIVTGFVDKRKVLNRVRRKGKIAELWEPATRLTPAVEEAMSGSSSLYSLYDTSAGAARPLHYAYINGNARDDLYDSPYLYNSRPHGPLVDAFSEDNPNNCTIM